MSRRTGSAGEMPTGNMAAQNGQPGTVMAEMPSGAMTSESSMASAAMASTAMPEGQPGVEGDMPSSPPAAAVGAQGEMPAGSMAGGRPGSEGDMPTGAMEGASTMGAEAAAIEPSDEPVLDVRGEWQLTFWVSEVTPCRAS